MNIVGKLFSNVKGFYNEINPATLTGAIDVVVIRHCDGTYTTSPWHVRFGKMGVIRAYQKVVDIEINDEPVDLHMKLGEAGEAFFVQEAEDAAEVPAYLATSPISPSSLSQMEAGLAALKAASTEISVGPDEQMTPVVEHGGTIVTVEDGKVVVSGIPPSATLLLETVLDERQYFSDSEVPCGGSAGRRRRQHTTVATQTNITASDVDCIRNERCATPPGEWYSNLSSPGCDSSAEEPSESAAVQGANVTMANGSLTGVSNASNLLANRTVKPGGSTGSSEKNMPTHLTAEDCQFEMDLSDDEAVQAMPTLLLGRCSSMPSINHHRKAIDESTDAWAANQYMSTAMNDYTPTTSPAYSRPTSPQSDSEVMCFNQDATAQTHLTGDRLILLDDVKWQWGEIPETTPHAHSIRHMSSKMSQTPITITDTHANCLPDTGVPTVSEEDRLGEDPQPFADSTIEQTSEQLVSDVLEPADCESEKGLAEAKPSVETDSVQTSAAQSSCSSDIVDSQVTEPLPETKKASVKKSGQMLGVKGGIYLDELNHDEPELTALYLYSRKTPPSMRCAGKDDDSESGRGASLPQSPVTVEADCTDANNYQPTKRSPLSGGTSCVPEIALSTCGNLDHQDARISDDAFNRYLVTHEALCENPALLADPNLVVRVSGKHYNWAIAAPLLVSQAVFNRPLTDACLSRLVAQHLPKKEASYRRGWRFWRRGETVQTNASSATVSATTKEASTSPTSSPPDTPQKNKDSTKDAASSDAVLSSDEESETVTVTGSMQHEHLSVASSALHSKDKCRKTLKLTSDQLASLKLKDGVNDASFSVTTQYQGTTRCHCNIYLWHSDDRIVVSDIDGTITKSDVLGQVLPMLGSVIPMIGSDWSQAGIAQLYQMIHRNGYKFLYLSARAIGQSQLTRDYLRSLKQCNTRLPDGPLLLSPSSLMSAFHKEVIERKPEQFKISCMRDIGALFPPSTNPFCAGFGNKINDVWAYREVGIPMSRIFTVNHKGHLRMEMPQAFLSSYSHLSDIVDHLFPPCQQSCSDDSTRHASCLPCASNYSSFTYWRNPLPDLDDDIADFIKNRDTSTADKNVNTKKVETTGKKAASPTVPTTAKIADPKSSAK